MLQANTAPLRHVHFVFHVAASGVMETGSARTPRSSQFAPGILALDMILTSETGSQVPPHSSVRMDSNTASLQGHQALIAL